MKHVTGLAELIRILILQGEMAPGVLLDEPVLAERFKTGRATLREALRLLEGRGLLHANGSGGMRVVAADAEGLAELLGIRAALESMSAAEAAERGRQGRLPARAREHLLELAVAVDAATAVGRADRALFADRTFHLALSALAGNRASQVALDHLWDRIVVTQLHGHAAPPGTANATREHRALVASVAGGDPEYAHRIARRHAISAPHDRATLPARS